jgi:hypothetical protein
MFPQAQDSPASVALRQFLHHRERAQSLQIASTARTNMLSAERDRATILSCERVLILQDKTVRIQILNFPLQANQKCNQSPFAATFATLVMDFFLPKSAKDRCDPRRSRWMEAALYIGVMY